MSIQIRLATLEDVPQLQELISKSVTSLSADYYSAAQVASALKHVFGVDTQLIRDQTYFIAEIDGQLAGGGGWSKRGTLFGGDQSKTEGSDPLLDPEIEPARIRAFYVHPDWARRGVGAAILAACEEAARDAGFKKVELVSTLPGEPLYSAKGYSKSKAMTIDTPDGESLPAYLMRKELS